MNVKSFTDAQMDIKKQLDNLDTATIKLLAEDLFKARQYIGIGREAVTAEKLTDEQLDQMANELQAVAIMLLDEKLNPIKLEK